MPDSGTGARALHRLGVLKLRGSFRRQLRRLRTPKGAFLTLCGLALFALWIVRLVVIGEVWTFDESELATLPRRIGAVAFLLTLLSMLGAFTHRGLFIPLDEIERLLSAPVSRRDLVIYRLKANILRSLLGGLLIALFTMRRMPQPHLAFVGILLGTLTLPVLHQLVAILAGLLEKSIVRHIQRVRLIVVPLVLGFGVFVVMRWVTEDLVEGRPAAMGYPAEASSSMGDLWNHPLVVALTAPFLPWARMIGATSLVSFLPWFSVSVAILLLLVEVTARIPIDFRELSLATSSDVAAGIRRARGGGGAASGKVSRLTVGWRIPWLFGRGPAGAVAWRKTGAILRKARGTVLVSSAVLGFVTWGATKFTDVALPQWAGAVGIAGLGTLYLCAGLRFDFREELDRMDVVKAWPLSAPRLFLAVLLPETCLVSVLIALALLAFGLIRERFDLEMAGVLLQVPPVALAWIALDNVVFLFSPLRFVPGQEGALQNAGRAVLLMLLRMLLALFAAVIGALAFFGAGRAVEGLGLGEGAALMTSFVALALVLVVVDAFLVWLGGVVLRRFDVSRDRG